MLKTPSPYYILSGREPVPADRQTWVAWYNTADRLVDRSDLAACSVITAFEGVVIDPLAFGPPQVFASIIQGGPQDGLRFYYATWDEAEAGHKTLVDRLRGKK